MTRYSAIDSGDAYRGNRRFSLSASRQTARAHPLGSHIIGLQTSSDNPTEKGRKRIAVACSRCRKRKIKCSGDPKNGQGCQNCRNAGSDPSQCQFLRVSSSSVECVEWPYVGGNGPQYNGSSNISVYGVGGQAISTSIPTSTIAPRRVQHHWPYIYPSLQSASDYCTYDLVSSETAYDAPYTFQNASSTFTANDPRPGQPAFSNHELLRQWPNLPKVERMQLTSFNNAPSTTSYSSSGMTYPVPLAPVTTVDPSVCFPSLGALAKSLPHSQQSGVRALTTPRPAHSLVENEGHMVTAASDYGIVTHSAPIPAVSWYERPMLESHPSAPEMEAVHLHGPLAYTNCAKLPSSSSRDRPTAYSCASMAANPHISTGNNGLSATFDLRLTSPTSTCAEESLTYEATTQGAHDPPRERVPSTGSLSYSTGSTSPKRGSVSSSGTDTTLLNGVTHQSATYLRHIRPAQTQGSSDQSTVRRSQQDRELMK